MSSYTIHSRCTRQPAQPGSSNIAILWVFFNKTITPLALRYEIVIANSALTSPCARGIIIYEKESTEISHT